MTTDPSLPDVPRALRDVWEWKESIYQEVKNLPLPEALHTIMEMARKASSAAANTRYECSPPVRLSVAEPRSEYRSGKP